MEPGLTAEDEPSPADFAAWRAADRLYISKSTPAPLGSDKGSASRYIRKVFDNIEHNFEPGDPDGLIDPQAEVYEIKVTPAGRVQIQLHVVRERGLVREIDISKITTTKSENTMERLIRFNREESATLISLIQSLEYVEVEECDTVRVDQELITDLLSGNDGLHINYSRDPERFQALIRSDASAEDIIAIERRRNVVATMERWLEDQSAFAREMAEKGVIRPEQMWQTLLENNPWVLGLALGTQVLSNFEKERLEQVVAGSSINQVGKRVDALMQTNGAIKSMVFVEIKRHDTHLLDPSSYRSGCWAPSRDLAGAVVQVQQTAHYMQTQYGDSLRHRYPDGSLSLDETYILKPKCYVVAGRLAELKGDSGLPIPEKMRSFEIFRRSIENPEIVTFDELHARAKYHLELLEKEEDAVTVDGVTFNTSTGEAIDQG